MPHSSTLRNGVAASTASGPVVGRRRPSISSPAEALERLSDRLDQLIYDVRLGAKSQGQHEQHVDAAEAIAGELRAVFRGTGRAQHPPLWQQGGRAAW